MSDIIKGASLYIHIILLVKYKENVTTSIRAVKF